MQLATIEVYRPFHDQIVSLKKYDAEQVFNYADPDGNKAARSHVHKLRQTRAAIDKARKEAKQESLDLGRRIDAEAKTLEAEVTPLIERHEKEIKAIEDAAFARESKFNGALQELRLLGLTENCSAADLRDNLAELDSFAMDQETWAEYLTAANTAKAVSHSAILAAIPVAEKREAEAAELAALRAEKEARAKADHEARITTEAAERATKVEREKADAVIKVAEQRERDAIAARERAEREHAAALEAERNKAAKLEADKKAEYDRLERDKMHRANVKVEVIKALALSGISSVDADLVFELAAAGNVPHLKVIW